MPTISVAQTYKHDGVPDMLTRMAGILGGNINGPYKKRNPRHKPSYEWKLHGFSVTQTIVTMIWPWLGKQKRTDIVDMMTEYFENRPPYIWGPRPKPKGFLDNRKRDSLGRLLPNV